MNDLGQGRLRALPRDESGFTLIELAVVVAIIGVLIGISVNSYLVFRDRGNDATARSNVKIIEPSITAYYDDQGTYVGMTLAGLKAAYDSGIGSAQYKLSNLSASAYCVESSSGGRTWHEAGPNADVTGGACP